VNLAGEKLDVESKVILGVKLKRWFQHFEALFNSIFQAV